ncbi:MAG: glucose 1-dehydrogenase [Candidatus Dojkabacteria bacterium]
MSDIFNLQGKTAIVTGASSGLGVQFAKALARFGANVVICARRQEKLESTQSEIEALGASCLAIQCDVNNTDDIVNVVTKTLEKFGQIDILVNNAGVAGMSKAEELPEDEWDNVVNTDLRAVMMFSKHVGKHMVERGYGRIVNIASMFGVLGNEFIPASAYHAAKGGVVNLTRALAGEWGIKGITVNAIGPGFFESEMTQPIEGNEPFEAYLKARCPMDRWGKEGELDGALIYLASDAASYTNGQVICVDGGWTAT